MDWCAEVLIEVAKAASWAGVHEFVHRGTYGSTLCANSIIFDLFSSVLWSCNALEHQMNFLHFVFSLNAF